jgi:hypothetical protein
LSCVVHFKGFSSNRNNYVAAQFTLLQGVKNKMVGLVLFIYLFSFPLDLGGHPIPLIVWAKLFFDPRLQVHQVYQSSGSNFIYFWKHGNH